MTARAAKIHIQPGEESGSTDASTTVLQKLTDTQGRCASRRPDRACLTARWARWKARMDDKAQFTSGANRPGPLIQLVRAVASTVGGLSATDSLQLRVASADPLPHASGSNLRNCPMASVCSWHTRGSLTLSMPAISR